MTKEYFWIFIIGFMIVGITACGQSKKSTIINSNDFILIIDSLKTILPTVKEYRFDFRLISSEKEFDWYKSAKLKKVDNVFIDKYLIKNMILQQWFIDKSLCYYACFIDCQISNIPLVILERADDNQSNIFLVLFDSTGSIRKVDILAMIEKSPDDFYRVTSEITSDCKINMTSVYQSVTDNEKSFYKDSVINEFDFNDSGMVNKKVIDSIRVITPLK